jgi:hypothetical protein
MKKFLFASLSTIIALTFSNCSVFEKADDVSFNAPIEQTFNVNITTAGTNVTMNQEITLDATDNDEINKYKDKIKEVKVNKVTYQVTAFTGDFGTKFTGGVGVGSLTAAPVVTKAIADFDVRAAFQSGEEFQLDLTTDDVSKIAALLKTDKKVKTAWTGLLSQTPVSFTVKVVIDATIKADALK